MSLDGLGTGRSGAGVVIGGRLGLRRVGWRRLGWRRVGYGDGLGAVGQAARGDTFEDTAAAQAPPPQGPRLSEGPGLRLPAVDLPRVLSVRAHLATGVQPQDGAADPSHADAGPVRPAAMPKMLAPWELAGNQSGLLPKAVHRRSVAEKDSDVVARGLGPLVQTQQRLRLPPGAFLRVSPLWSVLAAGGQPSLPPSLPPSRDA